MRLPDRRDLLNYLNGTIDTTASIDRTVPVDISSRRIIAKNPTDVQNLRPDIDMPSEAKRPRLATFDSEEQKSVEDQGLAKSQPNLEPSEGSALPSVIPLDAIQVSQFYVSFDMICFCYYVKFIVKLFEHKEFERLSLVILFVCICIPRLR